MKISFMSACIQFFGLKEGQTKLQFGQEVKQLTLQDRAEMTPGLEQAPAARSWASPGCNTLRGVTR